MIVNEHSMYSKCAGFLPFLSSILFVYVVDEGAIIDVQFNRFYHEPPDGFEEIMVEKSLL